jgi:transcriptional regulator with GAF, ATPase, and Fis domain
VLLLYHRDGVDVVPLVPGRGVVVGRAAPADEREPPADVIIPDECLSRKHARFTLGDGDVVEVLDLKSLNGTMIGGERVERATLRSGDQVMLGTIAAAVYVRAGDEAPPLGLEGHDALIAGIDAEIVRARFFGRSLSVLVVHAAKGEKELLPRWCPSVRQLLDPVDRMGLYGAGVVEILLPERGPSEALARAKAMVARREGEPLLVCGIATFPTAGTSAEALVSAAREAARSARPSEPAVATAGGAPSAAGGKDGALVLQSPPMRELEAIAKRVARSSLPVLLHGETGSGKEVLTRFIHENSRRRGKLVCVNCAAFPAQLVESTLFGHEKGAFTSAVQQHKGVFETADGGTLLLDEVGELPIELQPKLLRVLETKRVTRVGSQQEIDVDVRVIAATNRNLEAMSEAGSFRRDLFYRLNGAEISIPPLREHREDILPLAAHVLAREAKKAGRGPMTIDPAVLALLEAYDWPGNVRELCNAVERAVVIADGDAITPRDLPERIRARAAQLLHGGAASGPTPQAPAKPEAAPPPPAPAPSAPGYAGSLKDRTEAFERDTLIAVLRQVGGSQTEAARVLGLPLRTMQHKVRHFGLKKSYVGGDDG